MQQPDNGGSGDGSLPLHRSGVTSYGIRPHSYRRSNLCQLSPLADKRRGL